MLQELFSAIGKQAVEAAGKRIFTCPAEPEHVYFDLADGKLSRREAAPRPRGHVAASLEVITDFARRFCVSPDESEPAVTSEGKPTGVPTIWYSRAGIVCLLDDFERRDRVTMPLALSKQMEILFQMENRRTGVKQPEFIRQLRIDFADALGKADGIVDLVRRVKFRVNSEAEVETRHVKTSVGRTLNAEITGAGQLPEEITLEPRIFASGFPIIRGRIVCALEVDPQLEQFYLTPTAGQMEQAMADAEDAIEGRIGELLGSIEVPVYYGVP